MRAMVIDDSKATRSILRRMLAEVGVTDVAEASDGQEAIECLEKGEAFDFALVDWNMPVMNGYEFVCAVRARPEWSSLQLIMATTETGTDEVVKALEAGANEYVMKPFTQEIIAEKLAILGLAR